MGRLLKYPKKINGTQTIILEKEIYIIYASTTSLSLYLQTNGMDILRAYKMVKHTINTLENQSKNFEQVIIRSDQYVN